MKRWLFLSISCLFFSMGLQAAPPLRAIMPMKTANGKNNGTYSTSRIHASFMANMAVGYPGNLSTNVTENIIPHTINNTNPTPMKKRLNKNRERILLRAILLLLLYLPKKYKLFIS